MDIIVTENQLRIEQDLTVMARTGFLSLSFWSSFSLDFSVSRHSAGEGGGTLFIKVMRIRSVNTPLYI